MVECVRGIVDRQVGSEGSGQVKMAARYDRGNLGAAIFGELKRCRADCAGCAVDQDLVAGFQAEMLDSRIRVKGAFADDSLIEAQIRRHVSDRPGLAHAEIFRLGTVIPGRAHSKNMVSRLEHAGRRANSFDCSGEIHAEDGSSRSRGAVQQPDEDGEEEFAAIGRLTVAAWTRTSTSSRPGTGAGTSRTSITPGDP